jgi:hypothetical protein
MRTHLPGLCAAVVALFMSSNPSASGAGVAIGFSELIDELEFSESFTGTDAGGRPDRPFFPAVQPAPAYLVENTYGNPQVSFDIGAGFSFAADGLGTPGLVDGVPAYPLGLGPNASGAGSDTGFSQTGGSVDYAIPFGLRTHYVVQVDAVQVADRIDISSGAGPGIFAGQSLSVFFRGNGFGNASLFNGTLDTPIQASIPTFNTGITGPGIWYNYAVRFDTVGQEIEIYVNQVSVGVIDLTTFAGGAYANFSNAFVGAGAGMADGETRTWTDNFQVGSPVPEPTTALLAFLGLCFTGCTRRRPR